MQFLTQPLPTKVLLPVVRVAGATFAGLAFAGLVVGAVGAGPEWLAAAGGLGAVALGVQQVGASLRATQAKQRKVHSLARLIRRSLVEACRLHKDATSMKTWLDRIGNARSLDALQGQFRELQALAAELGGADADQADRAFEEFLRAADVINPLYADRDKLPPDYKTLGERARILERLIGAVDALTAIAEPADDEPTVSDEVRKDAESLGFMYSDDE